MSNQDQDFKESQDITELKKLADRDIRKRLAYLEKLMTRKQLAFCHFYIMDPNSAEAARKAKYNANSARQIGNQNLSKLYIREYIDLFIKIQDDQRVATAKEVLETITSVMRGELKIKTKKTVEDPDGVTTTRETHKASHKDRLYAAKLLGSKYKLWDDKLVDLRDAVIHVTIDGEDYGEE